MGKVRCGVGLLGLLLLACALLAAPVAAPKEERSTRQVEEARELLRAMKRVAEEPRPDAEQLWRLGQQMRQRFPGTPEWLQSVALLSRSASPLDRFSREQIPELERPAWLPPEVVGVLGENHGRHWDSIEQIAASPDGQLLASRTRAEVSVWETASLRQRALLPGRVGALGWARKGSVLATGTDNEVVLWDLSQQPGRRLAELAGHTDGVCNLVFPPDGTSLVSCSTKEVIFWDLNEGRPRQRRKVAKDGDEVVAAQLSPDGRFLIDWGPRLPNRLWRLAPEVDSKPVPLCDPGWGLAFAFSPDSKRLVATEREKYRVIVWDLSGPQLRQVQTLEPGVVIHRLYFGPDREMLVGLTREPRLNRDHLLLLPLTEGKRRQLRLRQGQPFVEQRLPFTVEQLAFLPDGKTLLLGGADHGLRPFDLTSGKERGPARPPQFQITVTALGGDGLTLAAGTMDLQIRLWELGTGKLQQKAVLKRQAGEEDPRAFGISGLAFAPGGRFLLSTQCTEEMTIWDLSQSVPTAKTVPAHTKRCGDCLFTPDGKTLVTLGSDTVLEQREEKLDTFTVAALRLWDWKDGTLKLRQRLTPRSAVKLHTEHAYGGRFSPGGKLLAFQVTDIEVQLWDVKAMPARQVGTIAPPKDYLEGEYSLKGFVFTPEGEKLLTLGLEFEEKGQRSDGSVLRLRDWDLRAAKPTSRILCEEELTKYLGALGMALSPDGKTVAVWSGDGVLRLLDRASGKQTRSWKLPGFFWVQLAPDSRHLLTMNGNGTLYIWCLAPPPRPAP